MRSWRELPAAELAARLFSGPAPWQGAPVWADGGDAGQAEGGFAPGRHLFACLPRRLHRLDALSALGHRGLLDWLRRGLELAEREGMLTTLLLSYDAGRNLERVPTTAVRDPHLPIALVAQYPAYLVAESGSGPWELRGTDEGAREALAAEIERRVSDNAPVLPGEEAAYLSSSMDRQRYRAELAAVLEAIARGDYYQANIARRLQSRLPASQAPALFLKMRQRNPAAFGALWALSEELWLASSSPECLLTFDPHSREAHSYPIKGTRPRGETPERDAALAAELLASDKDRAEHLMIVDLVRNDLGRVAQVGSVRVDDLFGRMSLPTVHHMVSDISARIRDDLDLVDLIGALFPGGSVTGAPKIAAMAAIEAAERLWRGWYCGSFGVVEGGSGRATFNILIRTAIAAGGQLLYYTGGGIVADSDPDEEWDETVAKAAAFADLLGGERG